MAHSIRQRDVPRIDNMYIRLARARAVARTGSDRAVIRAWRRRVEQQQQQQQQQQPQHRLMRASERQERNWYVATSRYAYAIAADRVNSLL